MTYLLLKEMGINVRGVVRNVTKAREVLGCSKCDASDGIFVGDITDQESLAPAMNGADALVIATGRTKKANPKDILFDGVKKQVGAFLTSPGPLPQDRSVALISMMETTLPDTFWNKLIAHFWGGWLVGFYSLNGEAFLMNANVPFTIVKACGLQDSPGKQKHLLVGHDDQFSPSAGRQGVSRHDVARILATAAANPKMGENVRFDLCSEEGSPQADAMDVIKEAMYPWDPRKKSVTTVVSDVMPRYTQV